MTYRWVFHPYSRQVERKRLQQRCESLQRNAMRILIGQGTLNDHGRCCPCISSWFGKIPRKSKLRRWPSRTILLELGTRILILIHIGRIQKGQLIHLHWHRTIWSMEGSRYQWLQYRDFYFHKPLEQPIKNLILKSRIEEIVYYLWKRSSEIVIAQILEFESHCAA